ncbi:hypothetical protein A3B45_04005 [Candidatus Daviesbacteria bacterium RIFCSPLOWO2_01_FULL_39_12]|uniref:Uncharacterized protein n=1 Tax=Candidatus Daviesbacteria bacterium RIFCSPLOWO2_01_FULL_39_12 TaxID=1797785 RepID=A0A1F5KS47_9BACT|nr:MAG: hypothetical protein A3D79_01860 [Candidatus Daviesbacteria bacterium RIFCSPHIGHO2_02_FULL_39_8]OGE43743.1 MAG: hypothetical protein A3B45_04005 [Candidatus Daviesbacteria bacterium RIFCSPLOWO2_01_FULL_39_12]
MDDDLKHKQAEEADEEITDEESSLGHAPKDVEDIDETLESVGLPSDKKGPKELNLAKAIEKTSKSQR